MHMVAQTKPRNARREWRSLLWDERASSVAQAAAVAILATALLGAMLLVVPSLGSGVDRSFSCLVGVLGGSGAGCSGGAAAQTTAAQDAAANAPEPPSSDDGGGGFWGGLLDGVQIGLDVVGLVPGVGEIADGANGLISLARGDYTGAALSFGAMIPFAGWGATGAKWVRTGVRLSDEAGGLARYGDEAAQYGDEAATAGRTPTRWRRYAPRRLRAAKRRAWPRRWPPAAIFPARRPIASSAGRNTSSANVPKGKSRGRASAGISSTTSICSRHVGQISASTHTVMKSAGASAR